MGSVCHGYICILLNMKLTRCSGAMHRSMVNEMRWGWGQSAMGISAFFYM